MNEEREGMYEERRKGRCRREGWWYGREKKGNIDRESRAGMRDNCISQLDSLPLDVELPLYRFGGSWQSRL